MATVLLRKNSLFCTNAITGKFAVAELFLLVRSGEVAPAAEEAKGNEKPDDDIIIRKRSVRARRGYEPGWQRSKVRVSSLVKLALILLLQFSDPLDTLGRRSVVGRANPLDHTTRQDLFRFHGHLFGRILSPFTISGQLQFVKVMDCFPKGEPTGDEFLSNPSLSFVTADQDLTRSVQFVTFAALFGDAAGQVRWVPLRGGTQPGSEGATDCGKESHKTNGTQQRTHEKLHGRNPFCSRDCVVKEQLLCGTKGPPPNLHARAFFGRDRPGTHRKMGLPAGCGDQEGDGRPG
jgi:hypothetical protein